MSRCFADSLCFSPPYSRHTCRREDAHRLCLSCELESTPGRCEHQPPRQLSTAVWLEPFLSAFAGGGRGRARPRVFALSPRGYALARRAARRAQIAGRVAPAILRRAPMRLKTRSRTAGGRGLARLACARAFACVRTGFRLRAHGLSLACARACVLRMTARTRMMDALRTWSGRGGEDSEKERNIEM
eukprot:5066444-Pleurochrysis_carterae.AAC.3